MEKHLIAAMAAFLAWPNLPSSIMAAPPHLSGETSAHQPQFSPEDFAALADARIAALKTGLKLTPAQERYWPAFEAALRKQAKTRAARIEEWREKAKEPAGHRGVIEGLRERAAQLEANCVELKSIAIELTKLADAAEPLYQSLDDTQKRRFEPLLRWHVGLPDRRFIMRERAAQRPQ